MKALLDFPLYAHRKGQRAKISHRKKHSDGGGEALDEFAKEDGRRSIGV